MLWYFRGMQRLGSELNEKARKCALQTFIHRWTRDHCPAWLFDYPPRSVNPIPVQFASDQDWLANTRFTVTKAGNLDAKVHRCESNPTWPDNPELRDSPNLVRDSPYLPDGAPAARNNHVPPTNSESLLNDAKEMAT